jgi:HEAT repeat protein
VAKPSIDQNLNQLFDAERSVRNLHDALAKLPPDELLDGLGTALEAALRLTDEAEASLRLVRIAALLGEHDGPRVVDGLVDVLGSEHPEARRAAGEELEELAFDRFKDVALGVERALKRLPVGSPALPELPYILAEIPEPGVAKLLYGFLHHKDPDAVAAAIEALVDLGDGGAKKHLEALRKDDRVVELADEGDGETSEVSLGELAEEAIGMLEAMGDDDGDGDGDEPHPNTLRRGGAP